MTNTYNISSDLSTRSKIATKGVAPALNLENEYLTEEENHYEEPKEVVFITQIPTTRESLFHMAFWNKSTKNGLLSRQNGYLYRKQYLEL